MKTQTEQEFMDQGEKLYGKDMKKWKFKCPYCGGHQTAQDFINAGKDPNGYVYFSCIGRYVEGQGCDWTLGGLFQIHKKEVISDDGQKSPVFEFADE